jgi:hypothetical protein
MFLLLIMLNCCLIDGVFALDFFLHYSDSLEEFQNSGVDEHTQFIPVNPLLSELSFTKVENKHRLPAHSCASHGMTTRRD